MHFDVKQGSLAEQACDVLVVNLIEGTKEPGGATGAVDQALNGAVTEMIALEEFEGKFGDMLVVPSCGRIPARKVLVIGLGKQEELNIQKITRIAGKAAKRCRDLKAKSVISVLHGAGSAGFEAAECSRAITLGTILATYEYNALKTEDVKGNPIEEFSIIELDADKHDEIKQGISKGEITGDAIVFARDLVNAPSNIVTPEYLAEVARTIASECGLECNIKDREAINTAGMGLFAAVARGAHVEPRFIELKYKSNKAKKTVAIVGKGITFDSGGYNLKGNGGYGMKDDMTGAAAVLAAMRAIGRAKPDVDVVGLIAATENMIGSKAIHPGDVFTSFSGKSVEVNNTDAEGRLTLADAVAYAKSLNADEIIDAATLTGACVTALGREVAGIFCNNDALNERLIKAGESCCESMWRLPLVENYKDALKSDVADLKNSGAWEGAAINGALFIGSFVGDIPWAHLDLTTATIDKDIDLSKKGGTGAATGTFVEYLLSQ